MDHVRDPLTIKGSLERIALLPLNYTRYNTIIVYERIFCRTRESGIFHIFRKSPLMKLRKGGKSHFWFLFLLKVF